MPDTHTHAHNVHARSARYSYKSACLSPSIPAPPQVRPKFASSVYSPTTHHHQALDGPFELRGNCGGCCPHKYLISCMRACVWHWRVRSSGLVAALRSAAKGVLRITALKPTFHTVCTHSHPPSVFVRSTARSGPSSRPISTDKHVTTTLGNAI